MYFLSIFTFLGIFLLLNVYNFVYFSTFMLDFVLNLVNIVLVFLFNLIEIFFI